MLFADISGFTPLTEALAHEVDISPTYLSQIESGLRNPTVAALHGIANKLGVSLGELFEGL